MTNNLDYNGYDVAIIGAGIIGTAIARSPILNPFISIIYKFAKIVNFNAT